MNELIDGSNAFQRLRWIMPISYVYNPYQKNFYIINGMTLLDSYYEKDKQRMVWIFDREETKELWIKWQNREL